MIPDYTRWLKTSEIHFMPYNERKLIKDGPWNEIPGLYIATRVLDFCYTLFPKPPPHLMNCFALLAWTTIGDTKSYFRQLTMHMENTTTEDMKREKSKQHPLYSENTKQQLDVMCKNLTIPVKPSMTKHHLL